MTGMTGETGVETGVTGATGVGGMDGGMEGIECMPSKSQQLRVSLPSSPATIGTKSAMWTAQSCVQDGKTARAKSLSMAPMVPHYE